MKKIIESSLMQKIFFALSIALIFFISSISYKNLDKLSNSKALVDHTYEVSIALEQLFMNVKDLETAKRNYILLQNDSIKTSIIEEKSKIDSSLFKLKKITRDNPVQVENTKQLEKLIHEKYNIVQDALNLTSEDYRDFDTIKQNLLKGAPVMIKIKSKITEMTNIEKNLLEKRSDRYDEISKTSPIINFATLLITIGLLSFFLIMLLRNLNETKRTNTKLSIANQSASLAEQIGNYGFWKWKVDEDEFEFSDNIYRMFGIDKQKLVPKLESFIPTVYPEDVEYVSGFLEKLKRKETNVSAYEHRIIKQDTDEIRYIRVSNKPVEDQNGFYYLMITQDITDEVSKNAETLQKNLELEASNKELQAFNYIASHDLQEPLRKIETFISRFEVNDYQNLSENGRQYFDRIKVAAGRMRHLIKDLLQFSRTNKSEKIFEETDLNELLENAKHEIAESIEEKSAVISAVELPTLNVIPFQIQQLFINLLGNSIKYSKVGVAPEITIDYQKVSVDEIGEVKFPAKRDFHQFTFSDNGIGFSQEYAQRIFELFSRLHNKDEIAGTGIGLAICKKIVENHKGFILAEGKPAIGSVFTIFLPE